MAENEAGVDRDQIAEEVILRVQMSIEGDDALLFSGSPTFSEVLKKAVVSVLQGYRVEEK